MSCMRDHDPSGNDMTRDIRDRLTTFGCKGGIERIAMTMKHIKDHKLPPNKRIQDLTNITKNTVDNSGNWTPSIQRSLSVF